MFDTAQETLFPISGDSLMSSVISLASVSGTLLLILTLAAIVILALLRLRREKPESTYDKLWMHANQSSNTSIRRKRRDDEHKNSTTTSQLLNSHKARQIEIIRENDAFQCVTTFTKSEKEHEKIVQRSIASPQTSTKDEIELGNGECLYDVTGVVPTPNTESEEGSVLVQPTTKSNEQKQDSESIEEICIDIEGQDPREIGITNSAAKEGEDGKAGTETPQEAGQCREYDVLETTRRINKNPKSTKDVEEIYDVVVNRSAAVHASLSCVDPYYTVCIEPIIVPCEAHAMFSDPTTPEGLISTDEDDTESSGYEEGTKYGSANQSTGSSTNLTEFDSIEDIYVEVGSYSPKKKRDTDSSETESEDEESMSKQDAPVVAQSSGHDASHGTNKQMDTGNVEEIYDVIVNQITTRNESSSPVPRVQPYAECTVPTTKVPGVDAYAVCVLPALSKRPCPVDEDAPAARNQSAKHVASGDHAYDLVK